MTGAAVPPASPTNLAYNDIAAETWFDDTRAKFVWTDDLPRGAQHIASLTSSVYGITTPTTINSTSFTFKANRWYRISAGGRFFTDVAGVGALVDIFDGTTAHTIYEGNRSATVHETAAGEWWTKYTADTTLTVSMRVDVIGTGFVIWDVTTTSPGYFIIEDMGAA